MYQRKSFEKRSVFGEDMDKSLKLTFSAHPVHVAACFSPRNKVHTCIYNDLQTLSVTTRSDGVLSSTSLDNWEP